MGASDSPYATDTGTPDIPPADSGAATATDSPPSSSSETRSAPDGGAGGGEAFDNPGYGLTDGLEATQADASTDARQDAPQSTAAPDGGAGGGEAFDNPDIEFTSPPGDAGQDNQRQEMTANDQPNDPEPAVQDEDGGGEEAVVEPDDRNDSGDQAVADDDADSQSSAAQATPESPAGDASPGAREEPDDSGEGAADGHASQVDDTDPVAVQPAEDRPAILPEAQKIAAGHAYQDHVVEGGEYPEISTPQEFEELVNEAMTNPTDSKPLERDRAAYWHDDSETVVIVDPNHPDGGTAFRPYDGKDYYDKRLK